MNAPAQDLRRARRDLLVAQALAWALSLLAAFFAGVAWAVPS